MREITINNVTAFERKMIHEIAEEMGLCHETSNDKKYIKVWRKLTNDEVAEKYAELERLKL
jgi:predicted RNA-binding protein Jag